jgi:hypothetical protein
MQTSFQSRARESQPPTEIATRRLRMVTGNRWPRKCACGCEQRKASGSE